MCLQFHKRRKAGYKGDPKIGGPIEISQWAAVNFQPTLIINPRTMECHPFLVCYFELTVLILIFIFGNTTLADWE